MTTVTVGGEPASGPEHVDPLGGTRPDAGGASQAGAQAIDLDVTIIVPIHSPRAEVEQVVAALGAELDREERSWECILVFDGVRGRAFEIAQSMVGEYGSRLKIIAFQQPFGESVCLAAAHERSRGRVLITSPHYVQIDPLELASMLAAIENGADFVAPWRHPRVDPLLNRLQSALFNWLIRQIIRLEFHDLNCYFRAMRREVFEEVAVYGDMYRFLPVIAHRQGFHVVEMPVRHIKEWGTSGFFGLGVYGRRILDILGVMFLTQFVQKPLRFFGVVGFVCAFLGAAILGGLTIQKLLYGLGVWGRPVFLVGVMFLILGFQVIGFGLVGELIIHTQARNLRSYRIERIYE